MIAIAASPEDRMKLAALGLPLVLVSSREEALALLGALAPTVDPARSPSRPVSMGPTGLTIDSDRRTAHWRERAVPLSPLEHDLLQCLLIEAGRTWTFTRLHREVWGNDHLGGRTDLQSVVKRLRRKLRDLGCPWQIHAVRGVGLRLTEWRPTTTPLSLPRQRGVRAQDRTA
ncbi:winged helix-turn-helix domain-containing protein [Nocardioides sp.]|uniref:winged helix-turn-helix domain-containing protein n=1 Tax=Nocardioides sp. TaxID=35761 RepID=UPI003D0C0639